MSSDLLYICAACWRERGEQVQLERHDRPATEDCCASTSWICPRCGFTGAVYLDMGELDLGIVRENIDRSDSNFEVFTDPPPG